MSDWVNGKKFPRIDKIELLAQYFGIQKSDLIEAHEPDETDVQIKLAKKKWKDRFGEVVWSKKELEDLMDYAAYLLSKRNQ